MQMEISLSYSFKYTWYWCSVCVDEQVIILLSGILLEKKLYNVQFDHQGNSLNLNDHS